MSRLETEHLQGICIMDYICTFQDYRQGKHLNDYPKFIREIMFPSGTGFKSIDPKK